MIGKFYTYKEYRTAKILTGFNTRFDNMCNFFDETFGFPSIIIGMHNRFRNQVSGQERDIKQVTPRMVITYSGIRVDRGSMSGIQAVTQMTGANSEGIVNDYPVRYRRLPVTASFDAQIVLDEPLACISLSEYIAMMALEVPLCKGDEYTMSTIIIDENVKVDNKFEDSNDYLVNFSFTLNMQIPEPMSLLESEDNYVLAGVGIQNSDGKWDETLKGELVYQYDKTGQPIYGNVYKIDDITGLYELDSNGDKIKLLDDNGDPIIDKLPLESESGQPLYGNYVSDGSFRLRTHAIIHNHRLTDSVHDKTLSDNSGFLTEIDNQDSMNCPKNWIRYAVSEHYNGEPNKYDDSKPEFTNK